MTDATAGGDMDLEVRLQCSQCRFACEIDLTVPSRTDRWVRTAIEYARERRATHRDANPGHDVFIAVGDADLAPDASDAAADADADATSE